MVEVQTRDVCSEKRYGTEETTRDECARACACVCVCVASDFSETVEVISVKLGTVTTSDMVMHHVLIILTLTFIQGHTALNRENKKCLIIS